MFFRKKKEKEPASYLSPLGTELTNYNVYYLNFREKLQAFAIALFIGGAVSLVFYGNQFLDATGRATKATMYGNIVIFLLVGSLCGFFFLPIRAGQCKEKRLKELARQFRGFLESLAVALASGMNMHDSLDSTYKDMVMEFGEDEKITKETAEMILGLRNNLAIEDMMLSLGKRSANKDIENFAIIFNVSYRAGGNIKEIVRRTADIIGEKMEISEEIQTAISSNKIQFTAMMIIPVVLTGMLRGMGSSFNRSFSTPIGIVSVTIAIGIFAGAYVMGQRIMQVVK